MTVATDTDFEVLFKEQYPRLVALGIALTSSGEVANDLAQETLARAHANWEHVSDTESPAAWLRTVGGGLLSYGSGEDDSRSVDDMSVIRPFGQPVRAAVTTDRVAISSSTADIEAWQRGGDRLIDDPRMRAAAEALDEFSLIEVQAYVVDFSVAARIDASAVPEPIPISEPFSVIAVGTTVDGAGDLSTVITYVFDDPEAATAMSDSVERAWHQPSARDALAPATFYQSIDVEAVGRTIVVTAPLDANTSSSKWIEFLARGEAVFTHAPSENTDPAEVDRPDATCAAPEVCLRYSIEEGDYAVLIAETFCISIGELAKANGWSDVNVDFPGPDSTIVIPSFESRSSCPDPTDGFVASSLDAAGGVEGPLVYWSERPDGERESEAALIEGLLMQEGDCLYVGSDEFRSVVLWEYGTRWLADEVAVLLPDGSTIPVGSTIDGRGGGYHAPSQLSAFTTSDAVIGRAEQCAGPTGEVAVIQS
ncbi:hypothetical protein YM304_03670 [Ilumatobacter coccineus YM16-304]|uniref:RNA polymerase sigma-70 region 2 domain-containing protein n=1 Tax=Ilumatobacter coccineus (strain NBRC 103263 / KCTC 29153 / YM16-304) TaxID=1313172 RepID=A0A6C7E192_ILUCY|nr:hypothetical protein YM304_03670 [Ilumatobacter coccineus YM16-304]